MLPQSLIRYHYRPDPGVREDFHFVEARIDAGRAEILIGFHNTLVRYLEVITASHTERVMPRIHFWVRRFHRTESTEYVPSPFVHHIETRGESSA